MSDTPRFYFRGTLAHPELFSLVADNVLNTTEAWLLLVIDGMTQWKGEGCWASHAQLGKLIHKDAGHVKKMIRRLKRDGFIIQKGTKAVGYNEMPVLVPFFAQRQDGDGSGPHPVLGNGINVETPLGGLSTTGGRGGAGNPPPRVSATPKGKEKQQEKKENPPSHRRSAARGEGGRSTSKSTGKTDDDLPTKASCAPSLTGKTDYKTPAHEFADTLYQAVLPLLEYKGNVKPKLWPIQFQILINGENGEEGVSPDRVRQVLAWFIKNIKDRHTPRVRCAKTFRERFDAIIDAMRRKADNDTPKQRPLIDETSGTSGNVMRIRKKDGTVVEEKL